MVPSGWKVILLDKITNIIDCKHRTPKYIPIGVPLVSPGTIKWGELDLVSPVKHVSFEEYVSLMDHCEVAIGDLVLSRNQSIGIASYVANNSPFVLGQDTVLVKPTKCDSQFLFYNLQSVETQRTIFKLSGGSTFSRINLGDIRKLKLLSPPLPEQRKIAKILATWDKAIATTEKLIAASRQQKKALMQQLLTGKKRLLNPETGFPFSGEWQDVKLGNVFEKITNGLTYDSKATEGLPVSRIETISTGKINHAKVGYAPNDERTMKFKLQYGDILYSHINSLEHIGRVAYFLDDKPLFHGMNLLLLRSSKEVDSKFIYFLLSSTIGKSFAQTHAKSAVNQASISTTDLKSFKAIIPSHPEQQKITQALSSADKEIEILEAKLAHLKQEKKALMQQLLTGKRRVQIEEA